MNAAKKRVALYGGAAFALATLGYFFATAQREADVMTLLSSTDVQLRLAYGMPAKSEGKELSARREMIDDAVAKLAVVERRQPGMAVTSEFRGFAHMMNGEFAQAASCYAEARRCKDVGDEQFDVLAFNEARMRAKAGDADGALRVFGEHAAALDARFGSQRLIEEAAILREAGRAKEAAKRLSTVLDDEAAEPMAWMQAGLEFEELGDLERAEDAYTRAENDVPIAGYHLARLKLRAGDSDTAVDCLQRAAKAVPAEVRRLLREEADVWQPLADDARLRQITEPVAAPVR